MIDQTMKGPIRKLRRRPVVIDLEGRGAGMGVLQAHAYCSTVWPCIGRCKGWGCRRQSSIQDKTSNRGFNLRTWFWWIGWCIRPGIRSAKLNQHLTCGTLIIYNTHVIGDYSCACQKAMRIDDTKIVFTTRARPPVLWFVIRDLEKHFHTVRDISAPSCVIEQRVQWCSTVFLEVIVHPNVNRCRARCRAYQWGFIWPFEMFGLVESSGVINGLDSGVRMQVASHERARRDVACAIGKRMVSTPPSGYFDDEDLIGITAAAPRL